MVRWSILSLPASSVSLSVPANRKGLLQLCYANGKKADGLIAKDQLAPAGLLHDKLAFVVTWPRSVIDSWVSNEVWER